MCLAGWVGNASVGITPRRVGTRLSPGNPVPAQSHRAAGGEAESPQQEFGWRFGAPVPQFPPPFLGTAAPQSPELQRAPLTSKPPHARRGLEGEQVLPFSCGVSPPFPSPWHRLSAPAGMLLGTAPRHVRGHRRWQPGRGRAGPALPRAWQQEHPLPLIL